MDSESRQVVNYPQWDKNTDFEKEILRYHGLPEDYHPTEEEGYKMVVSWMED